MPIYTPKYGILVNKINNWDTGNSILNSSRFIQDINGPAQPTYKSLTQLEAEGIWFIYRINYSVSNQSNNIFIDNWAGIWIDRVYDNSIFRKYSGFTTPMPDICIENIVSKKWPLPSGLDAMNDALKAYVSMFLELEQLKNNVKTLERTHSLEKDNAEEEITMLYKLLEKANTEIGILKFTEPIKIASELESIEFKKITKSEDELLIFFDTNKDK